MSDELIELEIIIDFTRFYTTCMMEILYQEATTTSCMHVLHALDLCQQFDTSNEQTNPIHADLQYGSQ